MGDGTALHRVGDVLGEDEAVLQVCVLHQAEEDVGLRVRRVETLVARLVVILEQDHGVLPLAQFQVLAEQVVPLAAGLSQAVDGIAAGRRALRLRVHVYGDEKVRADVVGDVRPAAQGHERVVGAREDDLDAGKGLVDLLREALGDVQGDVLLVGLLVQTDTSGVMAAMAGVDDDGGKLQPILRKSAVRHDACGKDHGP